MTGESQCPHGMFYPERTCSECIAQASLDHAENEVAQLKALNKQLVEALERARPSSPVGTVRSAIERALATAKEMEE